MQLDRLIRELDRSASLLRSKGMNPLEAVRALTEALASDANEQAELLSPALQRARTEIGTSAFLAAAFQQFVTDELRSVFGQYLTPPIVAQHAADLLVEWGGLESGSTVLDPFAGTGILLQAVGLQIPVQSAAIEINPSVAAVGQSMGELDGALTSWTVGDAFGVWAAGQLPECDAVIMNPPFGASLNTELSRAFVGTGVTKHIRPGANVPVELAALELARAAVRPGGIVVAVLPQSILTNRGLASFRASFFSHNELLHVTELPGPTFTAFRGVARSCVIVVRAARPTTRRPFRWQTATSVGYDDTGRAGEAQDLLQDPVLSQGEMDESGNIDIVRTGVQGRHKTVRLGDIATVFRGVNPGREQYVQEGPFLLKVGSLAPDFVSWNSRERTHVPLDWFERRKKKALKLGDICLTATAHRARYIGLKVNLIDNLPEAGALPSGEVAVIRMHDNAPFSQIGLLYYLRSAEGRAQMQALVRGSTAHLYPQDLASLRVPTSVVQVAEQELAQLHTKASDAFQEYQSLQQKADALAEKSARGEGSV